MVVIANPVLPGCYPDPSTCRVGDWYYLVTSTFEYLPGLPVMRSRDLAHWETVGHIIDRPGMLDFSGIGSSGGLYAPTIRHHDGLFWVVCTLVDREDSNRGGNFLVTATDPAGPWSDPIWLDVDGIDPSLAFDDAGRVWMHGTRLARDPEWQDQTEVWVREFSVSAGRLVGDEHVIWTGAVRGAVWAEGPHLYAVGGRWYLIAAEGGTEFHHAVSVARAETITGPYEGYRGNPVLTHRHLGRSSDVIGVGHADLVQAPDDSWIAVLLGMRTSDGEHYPLGRETFLCPVAWEDGWPVFAPGSGRVPAAVDAPWLGAAAEAVVEAFLSGAAAEQGVTDHLAAGDAALDAVTARIVAGAVWQPDARRAGVVPADDPRWTAVRALPEEVAAVCSDLWSLPVRSASPADVAEQSLVAMRLQHRDVDVRFEFDLTALADGEAAGVLLRQSERDHARLEAERQGRFLQLRAVHCRAGVDAELGSARIPFAEALTLALRARGDEAALCVGAVNGAEADSLIGTVDVRLLDSVATGGFLGLWAGAYATSNGAPARGRVSVRAAYLPAA